jgi:hypothetical protein
MTSMPFDTAALLVAKPTKPLPPKTTTYEGKNLREKSAKIIQTNKCRAVEIGMRLL